MSLFIKDQNKIKEAITEGMLALQRITCSDLIEGKSPLKYWYVFNQVVEERGLKEVLRKKNKDKILLINT